MIEVAQESAEAVRRFEQLAGEDIAYAGGKGANLGELIAAGLPVPEGFVVSAPAYGAFCEAGDLRARLEKRLADLDLESSSELSKASEEAREMVEAAPVPEWLAAAIREAYESLGEAGQEVPVAVRSSATGEDTASASFAGMNETFLNVTGTDSVIAAVRGCWASLFGARSMYYRARAGFSLSEMDIAVIVQHQVAATRAGVMFTIDPASGRRDRLVIEAAPGLGESVVSGSVAPDRYVVDKDSLEVVERQVQAKRSIIEAKEGGGTTRRELSDEESRRQVLSDQEVREVAEMGRLIEDHYGSPQDTEWCYDEEGKAWMLQSRPVTTAFEQKEAGGDGRVDTETEPESVLVRGLGASPGAASGPVRIIEDLDRAGEFETGDILVTEMSAPDWVPLMRKAAAIVTDSGGMTCHASIVSRELGIPSVVGTGDATGKLRDGEVVTVDGARGVVVEGEHVPRGEEPAGEGRDAAGAAPARPVTGTRILVNLSEPSQAERVGALDADGVGLLRAELMVLEALDGTHPRVLLEDGRGEEFTERMAESVTRFARAFDPRPITYRTIDFRTNEFRRLEGGERFEPQEANPMIGYRGALRYMHEPDLLRLELDAIARVHDAGHSNLHVMIPFVRIPRELEAAREVAAAAGLLDRPRFELWIMAEVPSVLYHLERYAALGIAGISIGSNDLTQLLLGADRDSELVAEVFDERDEAVTEYLALLISRARELGLQTSICGQAPSVHPEYADLLVRAGIDAISVNVDSLDRARMQVASAEQRLILYESLRNRSVQENAH